MDYYNKSGLKTRSLMGNLIFSNIDGLQLTVPKHWTHIMWEVMYSESILTIN